MNPSGVTLSPYNHRLVGSEHGKSSGLDTSEVSLASCLGADSFNCDERLRPEIDRDPADPQDERQHEPYEWPVGRLTARRGTPSWPGISLSR